jgi:hypothetical protein
MSFVRGPPHLSSVPNSEHVVARTETSSSSERAPVKLSDAALFAVLWKELSDMVGTAAAAILFKRAVRRALPRSPELAELQITRDNMDYGYAVPKRWIQSRSDSRAGLRELGKELRTLLVALTGTVVVHRLAAVSELRGSGLFAQEEGSS